MLPAYAGMIPPGRRGGQARESAPRVCGDDPHAVADGTPAAACSPRMRG